MYQVLLVYFLIAILHEISIIKSLLLVFPMGVFPGSC
jgi:hypothetical protein